MLKNSPDPVDVQDLQFKLCCRLRVFPAKDNVEIPQQCNLVASANRFGLVFIGTNTASIQAIQTQEFESSVKPDAEKYTYHRRNYSLDANPLHLSVNCDGTILAVIIQKANCPFVRFYKVNSFLLDEIIVINETCLSTTPNVHVTEVNWNPTVETTFTVCKSDGSLGVCELKDSAVQFIELPSTARAACFCWSPKGKQIAVGSQDGKIVQLKPDLKAVKVVKPPQFNEPHSLISLQWVSNYQFIGVFKSSSSTNEPVFVVVESPKAGEPSYINYYDICYSNLTVRPWQFYLMFLQNWNTLIAASANSVEVGVLGCKDNNWFQWIMGDAARAELPLNNSHQETVPIGVALNLACLRKTAEDPPTPQLLLLSNNGVLCCFDIVNLKTDIPNVCVQPEAVINPNLAKIFISGAPPIEQKEKTPERQIETKQTLVQKPTEIPKPERAPPKDIFSAQPAPNFSFSNISPIPKTKAEEIKTQPVKATFLTTQETPGSGSVFNVPKANNTTTTFTAPVSLTKPSDNTAKTTVNPKNEVTLKRDDIETEIIFKKMIGEEFAFLQSELKSVLGGKHVDVKSLCDSKDSTLFGDISALETFFTQVLDNSVSQDSEIHILKQNIFQSWAWYEEARSRYKVLEEPSMSILFKSQPLNSSAEKQLARLEANNYYLESQIAQAHAMLDEQWGDFQDYCKKTYKLQIPTMEAIFQTMVKQNAVLQKQCYILKDLSSRVRSKISSDRSLPLLISVNSSNLPDELKKLAITSDETVENQRKLDKKVNFTEKKVESLRNFLKNREYPHISVVKPELSVSVMQASPSIKQRLAEKILSKSPMKIQDMSLTNIQPMPKVLSFDSPKFKLQPSIPAESTSPAVKVDEFKFNKPLISNTLISSSPNSAFVSTSLPSSFSTPSTTTNTSIFGTFKTTSVTTSITSTPLSKPVSFVSFVPPAGDTAKTSAFSFGTSGAVVSTIAPIVNLTTGTISTTQPSYSFVTTPISKPTKTVTFVLSTSKESDLSTPPKNGRVSEAGNGTPFKFSTPTTAVSIFKLPTSEVTLTKATPSSPVVTAINLVVSTTPSTPTSNIFGNNKPLGTMFSTTTASAPASGVFNFSMNKEISATVPPTVTKPQIEVKEKRDPLSSLSSTFGGFSFSANSNAPATSVDTPTFGSSTTAATASIFGGVQATKPSIFASTTPTTTTTTTSIFGSIGTTTTTTTTTVGSTSIFSSTTSGNSSIFGGIVSTPTTTESSSPVIITTGTSSIFGAVTSTQSTTTTTSSIFGSATSVPSVASGTTTPSEVTKTTTTVTSSSSIFGSAPSSTSVASSIFGATTTSAITTTTNVVTTITTPTIGSSTSIFGNATSSIFGSIPGMVTTSAPETSAVLGTSTNTTKATSANANLFGTNTQTLFSNNQSSGFGTAPKTTESQSSVFGGSLFGSGSIFGGTTSQAPPTTLFGQTTISPSTPKTESSSGTFGFANTSANTVFGAQSPTTQSSIFGAQTTTPSVFGQTPATQSSIFGTSTPTTSIFGAQTTQPSLFGSQPTTQTSVFGSTPNPTTQSSIFGSQPSIFGTQTTQTSVFGSSQTPAASSTFQTPQHNPFGASKNVFGGGSTGSIFGGSSGSTFGNTNQAFGSSSSFGSSSVFGQQQNTGQSSFGGGSTFGSTPAGSFSSGGGGSVAQSGFGASSGFQKASGFGAGPVFGGSPSFGSTPAFGGGATFGGAPAFGTMGGGSPSKVFGGSTSGTFGEVTANPGTANAGFGNLANQPTLGFGNLAQQANTSSGNQQFGGSSSFSSWR